MVSPPASTPTQILKATAEEKGKQIIFEVIFMEEVSEQAAREEGEKLVKMDEQEGKKEGRKRRGRRRKW
jgi:hypothetical protein